MLENSSSLSEMFYLKEIPCLLNDIEMFSVSSRVLKTGNGRYGKIAKEQTPKINMTLSSKHWWNLPKGHCSYGPDIMLDNQGPD